MSEIRALDVQGYRLRARLRSSQRYILQKLSHIAIGALAAAAVLWICSAPAAQAPAAEDAAAIEVSLLAEVRETYEIAPGRQASRFVPAGMVPQGEVVYYTVRIHNPASAPARGVVVVRAIPENLTYEPGSATGPGADITFSVDGGKSFARPAELMVADPAGTPRPAVPADYTHIRWQLRYALAPGATALARFRAVFG